MKRIPLIITLGIIILIAGGVWLYQSNLEKRITPWDLIGDDASIVFELNSLESFKKKLRDIPSINKIIGSNNNFTKLIDREYLPTGKVFLSVHPVSSDDFGIVLYFGIGISKGIENVFKAQQGELVKKRQYNGVEINELLVQNKVEFSFALIDNLVLISSSSFLLEGAVRLKSSDGEGLFKTSNSNLFKLPTLKTDEGNVYLNLSNSIELTGLFLQPKNTINRYSILGSSLADIKLSQDRILMNGFVLDDEDNILSLFKNQEPQTIDFAPLISNRTSSFVHFGISNPDLFFKQQESYLANAGIISLDSLKKELSRLSISVSAIHKSLGNQLAICNLSQEGNEVTILNLNDNVGEVSVFDELATKISTKKRDSLYVENYAGYQIKLIDYKNFLYQLFYPLSESAVQSYFIRVGSNLILAENVELLKLFIDDIDSENTWGKSVEWNKFLSSSLLESNLNFFFDGKLASVYLRDAFSPRWKGFFESTSFLGIDKGSIQLSRLESSFYMNASLQFSQTENINVNGQLEKITFDFGNDIVLPISLVTNHNSKEIELMTLDSSNNLYLLSKELKTIWKHSLDSKIVDDIVQVDFFVNGKLQYFFTTGKSINLMDRLGRDVEGFPKELNTSTLEYSTVVDYDRSKKYRFLLTDLKGNLILTDKVGTTLEGWSPRALGSRMLAPPRHYRILGKDYFLALQQNGVVNLLNRRGEMAKGFPLDLGIRPSGDFFITVNNSLSSTYFTVVSNDGMKVEFGLDGQVLKREALIKRTGASKFYLQPSNGNRSFIFLRVDPSKIAIFDTDGKLIFEIENSGSTDWKISYVENRLNERYYCLYDQHQSFSYLYGANGQLLLTQPLESTQLPTLYFDEKNKTLKTYLVNDSQVSVVSLRK